MAAVSAVIKYFKNSFLFPFISYSLIIIAIILVINIKDFSCNYISYIYIIAVTVPPLLPTYYLFILFAYSVILATLYSSYAYTSSFRIYILY